MDLVLNGVCLDLLDQDFITLFICKLLERQPPLRLALLFRIFQRALLHKLRFDLISSNFVHEIVERERVGHLLGFDHVPFRRPRLWSQFDLVVV